jgi:hypothetical protein
VPTVERIGVPSVAYPQVLQSYSAMQAEEEDCGTEVPRIWLEVIPKVLR